MSPQRRLPKARDGSGGVRRDLGGCLGHSLSPIEAPRGDSRCCKGVERCRRRCWVDGSWPSSKFDAQAIYQASTKPLVEQGWMARLADISGPQQVCQCRQTSPGVPEAPHRDGFVYLGRSGCHRPISVAAPVPSGQRSSNGAHPRFIMFPLPSSARLPLRTIIHDVRISTAQQQQHQQPATH